jgi:HD-like signal output (HDOD) protein
MDQAHDPLTESRRALVVTTQDALAALVTGALDRLGWPVTRVRNLAQLEAMKLVHTFEVALIDVELCPEDGEVPLAARRALRRDALVLTIAGQADREGAGAHLCFEGVDAADVVRLLTVEIDRLEQGRLLREAYRLAASPGRLAALLPPALQAAHRLEWLVWNQPSLEEARRAVERQENLAKQVVRLARTLHASDLGGARDLDRVLLDLGLLRFMPLVKLVAARHLFPASEPGRAADLESIWVLSVARASAMRWLAARTSAGTVVAAGAAHDAGLFADTGASFLVWLAYQSGARRPPGAHAPGLDGDVIGHHEWLGERVLARWNTPAEVARVAAGHHRLEDGMATTHAGLAAGAMALIETAGLGEDPTGAHDRRAGERVLHELDLSPDQRRQGAEQVRQEVEQVQEALSS